MRKCLACCVNVSHMNIYSQEGFKGSAGASGGERKGHEWSEGRDAGDEVRII